MNEASLYENNCFITLTYNEENLPPGGSLNKRDFQLFMKRLRKKFSDVEIRYYMCGEYGEQLSRPHFHACLFNIDFDDKQLLKKHNGESYYTSSILEQLWPYGFSIIGSVTFESAAYVARYILKKMTGEKAAMHYNGKTPEYTTMSRRPGLGAEWLKKYHQDAYPSDFLIMKNKKIKIPRYYDQLHEIDNAELIKHIKQRRKAAMQNHAENNSIGRLRVRETIQCLRVKKLTRKEEIND